MKRILSLFIILVLVLGTLAACQPKDATSTEADIQQAYKQVEDMYKKYNGTAIPNGQELIAQVKIEKTVFTITWTSSNENVKVELNDGLYVVTLPKDVTEQSEYTLTATIKSEGGQEKTYTINTVLAASYGMVSNPQIGKTYKLALLHGNFAGAKTVIYFDGDKYSESNPWYMHVTTDILTSVDVTLEAVEGVDGAFRLSFEKDGVKKYIRPCTRDNDVTKGNVFIVDEAPAEYFTYSTEYNTLIYTHEASGNKFFLGSSGTNKSISCSNISYITGATNYPCRLYGVGGVEETLPELSLPTMPENPTSQDVVDYLYQLQPGQLSPDSYKITGVVTNIKEYSAEHGNITLTIKVEGRDDKPVVIYRAVGDINVDIAAIKVGDTITAFAQLTNYSGTYETQQGGIIKAVVPGTGSGEQGGTTQPAGSAVLDLVGNSNLVSSASDKNVFAANGITFTNDKGGNTQNDLTQAVQATLSQRAYKSTTVKIEYPGMTKIVITLDDYTYNGTGYMTGFDGMTVEGATFTRVGDILTIVFDAPTDVFQSTDLASQTRIEKIEVFTGEVEGGNGGNQGGDQPSTPTYTAPETGKAYKFYLQHTVNNKNYFFNGGKEDYKGGAAGQFLTTDESNAVEIFFETNGNGYSIYFEIDGVRTYLDVYPYVESSKLKCQFNLSTEKPSVVWEYDTTYGVIKTTVTHEGETKEFYAGNYSGSGTTVIRLSDATYINELVDKPNEQFAAKIVPADGTVTPPAGGDNGGNDDDNTGTTPTVPVIGGLTALSSLKTGDVVYIVAPAYNKAMSATIVSTYYQVAVDVTNGFSALTDAEKWTVTKNDDGSYTFTSLTNYKLSQSEGYNSFNSTTDNYNWTLVEVSTGVFKIQNVNTSAYVEYFNSKGNWSIYTNASDDQFEISFFAYELAEGGEVTPPAGGDNGGDGEEEGGDNEEGVMTHAEYLAVAKGGSVCIKGYVAYISGTNTFLVDAEGNGYYLFGSAVNATVGEEIIVTGTQDIFNNLYEVKSFTYTKTGNTTTVTPVDYTETLAANGFNVTTELQNKVVTFTGTLTASKTVTVGGKTVALYYKGSVTEPAVGSEVTVVGVLSVYNTTSQVLVWNQDGLKAAEHTCEGEYPCSSTCKICSQAVTAADHTYEENGFCVCGQPKPSAGQTTVTVSIADYATANNWANGVAYNTLTMDDNITVTANKTTGNNSNTGKYYNNGTNWRMYQNEAPEIKVTAAEGKTIVSIKITYSNANTGILTSNGQNITSGTIVTVNANSITFSVGNTNSSTTNGNIQITNIEVIYQ